MNLIIIGPPGTGKGTQARFLSKQYGIPSIATGDIMRDEITKGTQFGLFAKQFAEQGKLVPSKPITKFVAKKLRKYKKGFILDGFPRTIGQAKWLKVPIDKVIYIHSSKENIFKRLMGRKRSDDAIRIIKKRFKVYYRETKPVINYYRTKDLLIKINGDQSPKEVFAEIIKKLEKEKYGKIQ